MKKSAAAVDDRQVMIPIDLPPGPKLRSDDKARGELLAMIETLAEAKNEKERQQAMGDVLWALLNSAEFTFNH